MDGRCRHGHWANRIEHHHAGGKVAGRYVSPEFTVPLCVPHHLAAHARLAALGVPDNPPDADAAFITEVLLRRLAVFAVELAWTIRDLRRTGWQDLIERVAAIARRIARVASRLADQAARARGAAR
jgi:hypothetical protein